MPLNLGSQAFEAAQRLKNTEDWKVIVAALSEQMGRLMHSAIETNEADHCGYARGVRDVLWAFEVMEAGATAPQRATQRPTVKTRYG
jgi:hypothetical protein